MVNTPDSQPVEPEIPIIETNLDRIQWHSFFPRNNAPPRANVAGRTMTDRIDWNSLSRRFSSDEIAEMVDRIDRIDWNSLSGSNLNLRVEESSEGETSEEETSEEESSEEESSEEHPVYRVI